MVLEVQSHKSHQQQRLPLVLRKNEDVIVMWINSRDSYGDDDWQHHQQLSDDDIQKSIKELHLLLKHLEIFNTLEQYMNFMSTLGFNEELFIIVSGCSYWLTRVIPALSRLTQLGAIHIFCSQKQKDTDENKKLLFDNDDKVRGVFTDILQICDQLRKDIIRSSLALSKEIKRYVGREDEARQEPTFMYAQLFRDILLEMPSTDESKREMIEFCRREYANDAAQLLIINQFESSYRDSTRAIWCNDKNIALSFARDSLEKLNTVSVILQIEVDIKKCKTPFTNVSHQSEFKHEQEIIFTIGTVFRIKSIEQHISGSFLISLTLNDDEDKELRYLISQMRNSLSTSVPLFNMGHLMFKMGLYDKSERFYQLALNETAIKDNRTALSSVYNNLGMIYDKLENVDKAIDYYKKVVDMALDRKRSGEALENNLTVTYTNIGSLYYKYKNDYDTALEYFNLALELDLHTPTPHQSSIAIDYNNIGMVYAEQQRYSEALEMYEKCLTIQLDLLNLNRPAIANSYSNISQVYRAQGDYKIAIEYLNKALEISLQTLPPYHPDLAKTYNNLSLALYKDGQVKEALEYMKKSMEVNLKTLPSDNRTVVEVRKWIARVEEELLLGQIQM
ncbi:unnamed protein product [Didymodactylos carnosus]|uniref:Uncharacterized protein n=1 Tax=Didymodactylos carnosus TaxID=1234261 RepID=A0A815D6K9_9BILA|nr:unnamed protein product [Didymodactylos carnosus]CAF4102040.1 unnamed protein product [Didymodactylos carnosus]